jgi:YHS domain-containing protein
MTVDEASVLSVEGGGKSFYFCSEGCREKFLAKPAEATPDDNQRQLEPETWKNQF